MTVKTAKVLLVEDDEDDYVLTCDSLRQLDSYHFVIDWVTNPNAALEQLRRGIHDICLLDFQLGAYNGLTVLETAQREACTTPIIMLTGQSDEAVDQAALKAGAVDYLVKGDITTARFARTIRYALARQEIEKEKVERIKAETRNRSKDRFLAHLSHELRTPLTSILGYTELLLGTDKATKVKPELNIIHNNGKHLLELLNNVLDLSKITAGKLEYNVSKVKLDNFLTNIFYLMQIQASEKNILLTAINTEPLPEYIYTDPIRLRQVLINIIHNALKFTEQGQVELCLWTDTLDKKEHLFFKITDTGQGIPDSMLETIFRPFEQVEDIISRKEEGAGLGLAICSELIKYMGGTITVDSTINQGSAFTFSIDPGPITQQPRSLLVLDQQFYTPDNDSLASLTGEVLVVDDMEDIRNLIQHYCQSFGLNTRYAVNGQDALDHYQKVKTQGGDFDLILMDIHMPKLDGKRAIRAFRALGFDKPIIAITASTMKGVKQELKEIGFDSIVPKPIIKTDLHKALQTHLPKGLASVIHSERTVTKDENSFKKILIVEDDKEVADITILLFESLGVQAEVALTAQECYSKLSAGGNWYKVLLDLHLPDESGLELAQNIKQLYPQLALVMVSGEQVSKDLLTQAGIHQSILKPVSLQTLQNLI